MARLRHIAVCVRDLKKAAKFYQEVFDLKLVGREEIEIGSAIYMSDGVINLALLNFSGAKGNDIEPAIQPRPWGPTISVFRLTTSRKRRSASRPRAALSFSISAINARATSNASSRTRTASCSTSRSTAGSAPTVGSTLKGVTCCAHASVADLTFLSVLRRVPS